MKRSRAGSPVVLLIARCKCGTEPARICARLPTESHDNCFVDWWAVQVSNLRPPACKADASVYERLSQSLSLC